MYDNETFIREYNNVLEPKVLDELLRISTSLSQRVRRPDVKNKSNPLAHIDGRDGLHQRNNGTVNDKQIIVEAFWPYIAADVSDAIFTKMLSPYLEEFYLLKDIDADWMNGITLLQKTEPCAGYHKFHTESTGYTNSCKNLAWMIYLNDIEEGGETEFPMQKTRVKPKENKGVLWPAGVTHFHRGNPPYDKEKIILTGWLATAGDIETYRMSHKRGDPGHLHKRTVEL